MLTVVTPGPFGVGAWLTPETKRHLLMCYQFKFGSSATKVYAQIRREPPKLGSAADGIDMGVAEFKSARRWKKNLTRRRAEVQVSRIWFSQVK